MEYRYLSHEHRGIGKKFQATKYQAETYTLHKLLINNKDYTSDFKFKRFANLNRGKMSYYVQSEHSTHSAFSKNHADSFEANEVKNLGECNISLPEWSLAGDGYTVSIQKKAI